MNLLRSLTYRSGLLRLARTLTLTEALREFYFRRIVSRDGSFVLKTGGIAARFYVRNSQELRDIEGNFLEEEDFLKAMAAALRPADSAFDIGSHLGQFAIPLAKIVGSQGQVFAFDPEAQACEILRSNIALNRLTNVRVLQKGLGDANQSGTLFVGGGACPSLLPHDGDGEQVSQSQAIEILQGDWLVRTESLPIPRVVKIDVEGYEYSVLQGLAQTLAHSECVLLCCEIHPVFLPPAITAELIVDFVKALGFSHVENHPCRGTQVHMIASKGLLANATS